MLFEVKREVKWILKVNREVGMKKRLLASLILLVSVGSYGNAMAVVDLNYTDFSTTAGLNLSGTAHTAVNSNGQNVLRLTDAVNNSTGTAFSSTAVNVSNFSSAFQYQFSGGNGSADGIAFVIKNPASVTGANGGGMGYLGTPNSFAVEFDSWYNSEYKDPTTGANHIGIDVNGSVNSIKTVDISPNFNGSGKWYAWVDYSNGILSVSTNQTGEKPGTAMLSKVVNLSETVGSSDALVGFTAATGGANQNHDILSYQQISNPAPVPEPSTYVLMGIGGLLAAARLRKSGLKEEPQF